MIGCLKTNLNPFSTNNMTDKSKKDESIKVEDYQENPEVDYAQGGQYRRNTDMFFKTKRDVLYPTTRQIYEYIRNSCIDIVKNHPQYPKFNWKPKIIDVGCGGGFGSYILSHEADFVWGIDIDEISIKWAKKVFEKHKNNIYYSSQLTFDVIDITNEPRELMKFDIVACVEVIEHISDYNKTLAFLKRLCKTNKKGVYLEPPDATIVYISTPNRNHPKIRESRPKNKYHVREWTPAELYEILTKHFKYVTVMNPKGEQRDLDMKEEVMLFKCEVPIIT